MASTSKASLVQYLRESKQELEKVSWPTRKEVIFYSIAVVVATLTTALFIGVLDYILNLGLRAIIN